MCISFQLFQRVADAPESIPETDIISENQTISSKVTNHKQSLNTKK